MKILLIEDDREISEMLGNYLTAEGFETVCAYDGREACQSFAEETFDCVLLDLMIPGKNGLEVMKYIRQSSTVPILIVTAKDTDADKTIGLGLGADDYITKPFSLTEVVARVRANIRRTTQYAGAAFREEAQRFTGRRWTESCSTFCPMRFATAEMENISACLWKPLGTRWRSK